MSNGRVPLTGHAWIETIQSAPFPWLRWRRVPLTGHAWIETPLLSTASASPMSRAPHGARVD